MAKRWYVIHTYSGYENRVKTDLNQRIETYGMEDRIVDIQIPTEEVTEIKDGGKRETREVKVFPGYVLVRMELDDETWSVVRNTAGVTGFVGSEGNPVPLRRSEFNKLMGRGRDSQSAETKRATVTTSLEPGMPVKVVSGPLADFTGEVSEVMLESGKVKVMLAIFGRETPVELTLDQVSTRLK
ncbi:antitermination protein NusG [Olsenella sp. oral taxon 807]|jgi:transcription termination/antitermination factor nusG|uniref:transcription termination/antitermination protein NusG n=1 Tax=Olsenella sp. oral taxon 807 TaxID=712411 RepID=UPI000679F675|nr:transcription termination/antitermination protein NusG [Olsenella sp. oral taxon 807]AKT48037.1 antitermination protein NusG [Olsenella sp. oral taxon 807]